MPLSNLLNTTGGLVSHPPLSKRRIRILYVESNSDDIFLLNRLLKKDQRTSYELDCVLSLADCIKVLKSNEFELILLELKLGDSWGIDTLNKLIETGIETPIIILTNMESEELGEESIKLGAEDYLPKSQANILLLRSIHYALERHQLLKELREKATEDPLTHLLNRAAFFERLEFLTHQANRSGDPFVAAMLDLDGFKPINDQWGHHAGDEVLKSISHRLKESLRRSDIIGRYGGDEFVLLLTNYKDIVDIRELLESKRSLLTQPIAVNLGNNIEHLHVGVSIGAAEWLIGEKPGELLSRADEAMYESKRQGKNRITFHSMQPSGPCKPHSVN